MRGDPELIRPSEKTSSQGWCGAVNGEEQGLDSDQVVEEVEVVTADPAGVAGGGAVAVVAVVVDAPAVGAGLGAGLDPAALAGDG